MAKERPCESAAFSVAERAIFKRLAVACFVLNLCWIAATALMPVGVKSLDSLIVMGWPLCFVLLPFSTGALVVANSRNCALLILMGLTIICILGFGFWGTRFGPFLPIWIGLMIPAAVKRSWWSWLIAIILTPIFFCSWMAYLEPLGRARPKARTANDTSNLKQIGLAILMYNEQYHVFPEKLSKLKGDYYEPSLRIFVSPRGAGSWREGPLHRWIDEPPYPGPIREITSWSEVDGGDYLYRKPPADAPTNTIMVMTRPGLLYRYWVNVGFVEGNVETLRMNVWKHRADVIEFLKQTGVQQE